MAASAPARAQSIELTVWYPTDAKGPAETIGGSKVFKGTPALRNAPVAKGQYPVIVLTHGGFRAAPHHEGWIASSLAARGYIVGVTRPPSLGPPIMPGKAAAVGFFLGGTSASALASTRTFTAAHAVGPRQGWTALGSPRAVST
jgi:predicted dienelactone hydrolase